MSFMEFVLSRPLRFASLHHLFISKTGALLKMPKEP